MERILLISLLRTAYYYSVLLQSVTDKLLLPVVHIPVNAVSYSSGGRHGLLMYRNILNDVQGKCHFHFISADHLKTNRSHFLQALFLGP